MKDRMGKKDRISLVLEGGGGDKEIEIKRRMNLLPASLPFPF